MCRHQSAPARVPGLSGPHPAPGRAGKAGDELRLTGSEFAISETSRQPSLAPVDADEFARLIDALGPFEANPRLAVGLSGGPDSMALTLLLGDWVRSRGGELHALTVDHGLRSGSAAEAREVGSSARRLGARHHVLRWLGPKPAAAVQEAARAARYGLLFAWCARRGILHLFTAHHLEDQAETFLMRASRGSGKRGLAAMSAGVEHREVRLLRPLLGIERGRLRSTLAAATVEAVIDPSNEDVRFARVRVRSRQQELASQGLPPRRLAGAAARIGGSRREADVDMARALANMASLHPAGFIRIQPEGYRLLTERMQLAALEAALCTVGGSAMPSRSEGLRRLQETLDGGDALLAGGFSGATLAGCRLLPDAGKLLLCREPEAAAAEEKVDRSGAIFWDRRFHLRVEMRQPGNAAFGAFVARLGLEGWSEIVGRNASLRKTSIPWPVRPSLPALWDREGVLQVPHFGYRRANAASASPSVNGVAFRPARPLAGPGFTLASALRSIM